MIHTMTMDDLTEGQTAVVCGVAEDCPIQVRLQDLGLIVGTEVRCVLRAPSGNPAAYDIRGTVLALRREDAAAVRVRAR